MKENFFLGRSPLGFHRVAFTEWGDNDKHPPAICVHGLTRNGRDFDYLARNLENDMRVFCPDVVGRGKSDDLADPLHYNYPQYMNDMTAMMARTGSTSVDWVGTSMGGIIGMLLAAEKNTPIRRLVVNDVGPFIPLLSLKRIGAYAGMSKEFADVAEVEAYMRQIYEPFGDLSDENWRHLAEHGTRTLNNGKLVLAHDPTLAQPFLLLDQDVDFWSAYDKIRCPVLLLRGLKSDILSNEVAQQMTRRGPKAQLIEFPKVGHAPALMGSTQISVIANFLNS
jgi:pimeloyl-ACP methyl ester carboxylesterase